MFVMLKCQNIHHQYFNILEANRNSMDNVEHSNSQIVVCCSIHARKSPDQGPHISSIIQKGEDRTRFIKKMLPFAKADLIHKSI